MSAALLVLLLGSVSAEARAPFVPVPLPGVAEVTGLCRALSGRSDGPASPNPVQRADLASSARERHERALNEVYQVTVEAPAFRFRRYEPERERLVVDTRWPLGAAGGWLALDLGRQELALDASPELADRVYRFWRDGQVRLVLTFEVEDEAQCGGMELIAPRPLSGTPVSLVLEDLSGATLLQGADELAAPQSSAPIARREAALRVDPVVVLSGRADPVKLTALLRANDALRQCPARAPAERPRGTVVFQAEVGRGGRPGQLSVALDELDDPPLVACLHDQLSGLRLPGAQPGARLLVPIALERP